MRNIKRIISTTLFGVMCIANANAQLVEQPSMGFSGNYDVKMVSAPALQPAWISSWNPMTVVDIMTNEEMFGAGDDNALNNRLDWSFTGKAAQAAMAANHPGATGVSLVYADCDDDMSTFQSSVASLDFGNNNSCSEVVAAYLYWTGTRGNTVYATYPGTPTLKSYIGDLAVGNMNNYNTVKFKAPGMADYVDITATRNVTPAGDSYVCMADLTQMVNSNPEYFTRGLYWVANLKSGAEKGSGGARAGWSLVVIYSYPNCPQRVIKFWDQNGNTKGAGNGTTLTFNFKDGEVPASGNSVSYLGFIGLDGEDTAPLIMDNIDLEGTETQDQITAKSRAVAEQNKVVFNGGNGNKDIQPFLTDQAPVHACNEKAVCGDAVYCGFVSSQMTTYDPETGLNGNQITRLPNNIITLGYDAHHVKLPAGSMAGGARTATAKLPEEQNGNYMLVMAYMAIELASPDVRIRNTANVESTKPGDTFRYKVVVENKGSVPSYEGGVLRDTIDRALDYVGNITFKDNNGNLLTECSSMIKNQGADENEVLIMELPSIAANDSVIIEFDVKAHDISRTDIWNNMCNRYIKNRLVMTYYDGHGDEKNAYSNVINCNEPGVYFYIPVISEDLDVTYSQSHYVKIKLKPSDKEIRIKDKIREIVSNSGVQDADEYVITDDKDQLVSSEARFPFIGHERTYYATKISDDGCKDVYTVTEQFVDTVYITVKDQGIGESGTMAQGLTSGAGRTDATVEVKVEMLAQSVMGMYKLEFYDESNRNLYTSYGDETNDFYINGLAKGNYTLKVSYGTEQKSVPVFVDNKEQVAFEIEGVSEICKNESFVLGAKLIKTPSNSEIEYRWQSSSNNGQTWVDEGKQSSLFVSPLASAKMFRVSVCANGYQAQETKAINTKATPKVSLVNSSETISSLDQINKSEISGDDFDGRELTWSFHKSAPSSATDNSSEVSSLEEMSAGANSIYVRVATDEQCYDVAQTTIMVSEDLDFVTTVVNNGNSEEVKVSLCGMQLTVSGTKNAVTVYASSGALIATGQSKKTVKTFMLPARGVYVLRIGEESRKILVK